MHLIDVGSSSTVRRNALDKYFLLVLVLGTVSLYFQVRHFDYVRFDDPLYVSQNWQVQSGLNRQSIRYALTTVVPSNWTPVIYLTELVVVQLFGASPRVFHTVCALFHTANVALLYYFLSRSTDRIRPSAVVAMLWGWHPLRVESVAWVGELRDVECGFFWLMATIAYAHFRAAPSVMRYGAIACFTCLAVLSKPMAVTLPLGLLLLSYWPLRMKKEQLDLVYWIRRFVELLPLFILCALISVIALKTQAMSGMVGSISHFPVGLRLSNAAISYLKYVLKTFVPTRLGLIYPHPAMLGHGIPAANWICACAILLAITFVAVTVRRSKPYVLAGWLWFVVTLLPVIGLIQLGEAAMADRYSYVPAMGLTFAFVWLIADLPANHKAFNIGKIAGAILVITAAFVSCFNQIGYWRNSHTLMVHSNQVISDDFLAQGSLSMDASAAGDIPEALRLAQSAVRLVPTNEEAHHALAIALQFNGQPAEALREFVRAIRCNGDDPGVRVDAGRLLTQEKKLDAAVVQFHKAIDLSPGVPDAHHYLAVVLGQQGNYEEAIKQWKIAVTLNPQFGLAQGFLADALRVHGDSAQALEHYAAALRAGESNPQWKANLVWALATDPGTSPDKLQQLVLIAQQACDQTHLQAAFPLYAYSLLAARLGRFDDAVDLATHALDISKDGYEEQMVKEIKIRLEGYRNGNVSGELKEYRLK